MNTMIDFLLILIALRTGQWHFGLTQNSVHYIYNRILDARTLDCVNALDLRKTTATHSITICVSATWFLLLGFCHLCSNAYIKRVPAKIAGTLFYDIFDIFSKNGGNSGYLLFIGI